MSNRNVARKSAPTWWEYVEGVPAKPVQPVQDVIQISEQDFDNSPTIELKHLSVDDLSPELKKLYDTMFGET